MSRHRFSLLHATYKREGGPLEVRNAWLDAAEDPDSVEYLFSMDVDDVVTVALTKGLPRLVNPALGEVTAVRNWNAAAAAATGDLLVVIADDLFPPSGWDRALTSIVGDLDPVRTAFAVKVADMDDRPTLLRHPVVSRAFYSRFGLFSTSYRGVYCDDDLTARAFWRSVILDGRSLRFEHRNRFLTDGVAGSESHGRLNRPEEYERGGAQYVATWSHRERAAKRLLVSPTSGMGHWGLLLAQRKLRARSNVDYALRGVRKCAEFLRS